MLESATLHYGLATKTGSVNGEAAGATQLRGMHHTDSHFCFTFVASRAAVRRCAWLDKYIAMRLFQSLDASPFAPCEYWHRRMSRGQAVTSECSRWESTLTPKILYRFVYFIECKINFIRSLFSHTVRLEYFMSVLKNS
jgi:hypothetical protein